MTVNKIVACDALVLNLSTLSVKHVLALANCLEIKHLNQFSDVKS